MKRTLICAAAGLLFAGCASTEDGTVRNTAEGTHYGLIDQPQTSVAGEGTLMPGAYDPRHLPNGQFTGQERTQSLVGQAPTLPREADARQMERTPGNTLGTGAGALGQAGIPPSNAIDTTLNPALSPSASEIYRAGETGPATGVGTAPGPETGSNVQTNNPPR
jgi:hypothetical protein